MCFFYYDMFFYVMMFMIFIMFINNNNNISKYFMILEMGYFFYFFFGDYGIWYGYIFILGNLMIFVNYGSSYFVIGISDVVIGMGDFDMLSSYIIDGISYIIVCFKNSMVDLSYVVMIFIFNILGYEYRGVFLID